MNAVDGKQCTDDSLWIDSREVTLINLDRQKWVQQSSIAARAPASQISCTIEGAAMELVTIGAPDSQCEREEQILLSEDDTISGTESTGQIGPTGTSWV